MMMAMTMNVMMKRQLLCQRFSLSRKAQPWWTHLDTEGPSLSSALSISSDFFIVIKMRLMCQNLSSFYLCLDLTKIWVLGKGGEGKIIINHHHSSHVPPSPSQLFSNAEDEHMNWKSNENNWLPLNDDFLLCHDLVKSGPYKLNQFKLKELKDQKRGDDKNQSKLPLEAPPRAIDGYYFQFTTTIAVNAIINNLTTTPIIILFSSFFFNITTITKSINWGPIYNSDAFIVWQNGALMWNRVVLGFIEKPVVYSSSVSSSSHWASSHFTSQLSHCPRLWS